MEEKVKMMDQLAAGYAAQGRNIEFSNSAIANTIYDPNASLKKRVHCCKGHLKHIIFLEDVLLIKAVSIVLIIMLHLLRMSQDTGGRSVDLEVV